MAHFHGRYLKHFTHILTDIGCEEEEADLHLKIKLSHFSFTDFEIQCLLLVVIH